MSAIVIPVVVVGAVGAYVVIRARWYTEALFAVALIGAIGAAIAGVKWLSDSQTENDTAAAILFVGGIGLVLGCAVAARFLFPGRPPSG